MRFVFCVDNDSAWVIPSSVVFTKDFHQSLLPRSVYSVFIAGDLHVEGRLNLSTSLLVGGSIHCNSLYKNAESDRTFAKEIIATQYLCARYPGEHFVATERIVAPLVYFSCVAWTCPKIEAEIFLPDYQPQILRDNWEAICKIAGVPTEDFNTFADKRGGDIARALSTMLEDGRLQA